MSSLSQNPQVLTSPFSSLFCVVLIDYKRISSAKDDCRDMGPSDCRDMAPSAGQFVKKVKPHDEKHCMFLSLSLLILRIRFTYPKESIQSSVC